MKIKYAHLLAVVILSGCGGSSKDIEQLPYSGNPIEQPNPFPIPVEIEKPLYDIYATNSLQVGDLTEDINFINFYADVAYLNKNITYSEKITLLNSSLKALADSKASLSQASSSFSSKFNDYMNRLISQDEINMHLTIFNNAYIEHSRVIVLIINSIVDDYGLSTPKLDVNGLIYVESNDSLSRVVGDLRFGSFDSQNKWSFSQEFKWMERLLERFIP